MGRDFYVAWMMSKVLMAMVLRVMMEILNDGGGYENDDSS